MNADEYLSIWLTAMSSYSIYAGHQPRCPHTLHVKHNRPCYSLTTVSYLSLPIPSLALLLRVLSYSKLTPLLPQELGQCPPCSLTRAFYSTKSSHTRPSPPLRSVCLSTCEITLTGWCCRRRTRRVSLTRCPLLDRSIDWSTDLRWT